MLLNRTSAWAFALFLAMVGTALLTLKGQLRQSDVPSGSLPQPTQIPGMEFSIPIDAPLWCNDHQVLRFQSINAGAIVDTVSRRETPLTKMDAIWSKQGICGCFDVALSPNGKWLLWRGFSEGSQNRRIWIAAALDGSRIITWPCVGSDGKIAWMQDSKHWIQIPSDEGVWRSSATPTPTRFYSLDTATVKTIPLFLPSWVSGCWFTPKNHLIVASLVGGAGTDDVYDFVLPSPQPVRKVTLSLPATDITECALSPKGNQFAWQLYKVHLWPRANLAERAMSLLFHRRTSYTRSVWVSDFDGGHLRQVTSETERVGPTYIHWTPDSKRIGFRYQNALWTVPAPVN